MLRKEIEEIQGKGLLYGQKWSTNKICSLIKEKLNNITNTRNWAETIDNLIKELEPDCLPDEEGEL